MHHWTTNGQPSPEEHPSRRQGQLQHAQQSYLVYEPTLTQTTEHMETSYRQPQGYYGQPHVQGNGAYSQETTYFAGAASDSWNNAGQVSSAVAYQGYPATHQYTSEWQQAQAPLNYPVHDYSPQSNTNLYTSHPSYSTTSSPYLTGSSQNLPRQGQSPDYYSTNRLSSGSWSPGSQDRLSLETSPTSEFGASPVRGTSPNTNDYSYQDHVRMFDEARLLRGITFTGPFVPQLLYKPLTPNDFRRYVEEVSLEAPIQFWASEPEECGISLDDAYHSRVRRLQDRDQTVFRNFIGPSISIRVEWPGYRPWSRQIPTRDFRSPPGPITRAKLAKNVAKCVQRFILERQNDEFDLGVGDSRWKVGNTPDRIQLQDLVLVSIHHVSLGSWQPQLRLRRPIN